MQPGGSSGCARAATSESRRHPVRLVTLTELQRSSVCTLKVSNRAHSRRDAFKEEVDETPCCLSHSRRVGSSIEPSMGPRSALGHPIRSCAASGVPVALVNATWKLLVACLSSHRPIT